MLAPILSATVAGVYTVNTPDYYTARTQLFIMIKRVNDDGTVTFDMGTSSGFAGDYAEFIQSPNVLEKTATALNRRDLDDVRFSVQLLTNTHILYISATSIDPVLSQEAANTISEVFIEYIKGLMQIDSISITAKAELPTVPSSTSASSATLIAFAVGLIGALGIAFAVEMLNTHITTPEEIEELLELPVLARVEGYQREYEQLTDAKKSSGKRQPLYHSVSQLTQENVRTLVNNITFATMDKPLQTIVITSTVPNEGKSSMTVMIASVFALENKRTLIVDCDLRKSNIGKILGRRNRYGLTSYLMGHCTIDDIISSTDIPGMFFVDNNQRMPSPSSVPKTDAFKRFLYEVKERFDLIVFDTPPLGLFIDAAVLAAMVDASILIVGKGKVEREMAIATVDQLRKANPSILGAVMNFENRKASAYYIGQSYYGYGYGYGYRYGSRYNYRSYGYGKPDAPSVQDARDARADRNNTPQGGD